MSDTPVEHFGKWVEGERRARGLSEAGCARQAGITPQRWNNMEKHSRTATAKTAQKVADVLGLPLREVHKAAGLIVESAEYSGTQLGRRLDLILLGVSESERQQIEQLLESDARKYVRLVTTLRGSVRPGTPDCQ